MNGVLTITPKAPLQDNTTYEVFFPAGGIRDAAGNGMQEYGFLFSTGEAIQFTVSATDPEDDALEYRFDFGDAPYGIAPAPDGSAMFVTLHGAGRLVRFEDLHPDDALREQSHRGIRSARAGIEGGGVNGGGPFGGGLGKPRGCSELWSTRPLGLAREWPVMAALNVTPLRELVD